MPTGYTADLYEGKQVTFEQFVLKCARAFMYSMRDEPMDAPIRDVDEEVKDSYHKKGIEKAHRDIAKYAKMTVAEAGEIQKAQKETLKKKKEKAKEKSEKIFRSYNAMLGKVKKWDCPEELNNLKKYMTEQLEESINFDCSSLREEKEEKMTAKQFLEELRDDAQNDLEYHTKEFEKEKDVARKNAAWIRALKTSVKGKV